MTIEEEAREMIGFLKALRVQVVTSPEFASAYPQSKKVGTEINELLSDLESNLEGLEKAEPKAGTHLRISPLKEDVDISRLNLAHAKNKAQTWWGKFRATALKETSDLMKQAQHAKPEKGQLEKITEGLQQFEKFLTASADVMEAAIRWSIVIGTGLITAVTLLAAVL